MSKLAEYIGVSPSKPASAVYPRPTRRAYRNLGFGSFKLISFPSKSSPDCICRSSWKETVVARK